MGNAIIDLVEPAAARFATRANDAVRRAGYAFFAASLALRAFRRALARLARGHTGSASA